MSQQYIILSESFPPTPTQNSKQTPINTISSTDHGEWAILILVIILIIFAVVMIIVMTNMDKNNNANDNRLIVRTEIAYRKADVVVPEEPQIFITSSQSIENIGSECQVDSNCSTGNCSTGYCQPVDIATGQAGAVCMVSGPPCNDRFVCREGRCVTYGSDLFGPCRTNRDCKSYYLCDGNYDERVCQFDSNPNSCSVTSCVDGYQCSDSNCIGSRGVPCISDENCVNGCDSQSIVRYLDGRWVQYAVMPNNVRFDRIIATTRLNGDDIWGLDLSNGLYYWRHDGVEQNWIKVIDANIRRPVGEFGEHDLTLVDIAVAHPEAIYVLYRAVRDGNHIYLLYRLNMFRATQPNSTIRQKLVPVGPDGGIQYTEDDDSFTEIIGLDAIMSDCDIVLSIYGKSEKDCRRFYMYSMVSSGSYFRYVGPSGQDLGPNNLPRMVSNRYHGDRHEQEEMYSYLRFGYNDNDEPTSYLWLNSDEQCLAYDANLLIYDYTTVALDGKLITYLLANDRSSDRTHLYISPDYMRDAIYPLPGHVSSQSKVSATSNGLYMYSPGVCR